MPMLCRCLSILYITCDVFQNVNKQKRMKIISISWTLNMCTKCFFTIKELLNC